MSDRPSSSAERLTHWDGIYGRTKAEAVGWYQSEPVVSLALIGSLGIAPEAGIVDVGGGASTLVDRLVSKGFSDLTVLDISPAALHAPRQRLGPDAPVAWLVGDILEWEPTRTYDLWHDRAVFHFLCGLEIEAYRSVLHRALAPGGALIMATFAHDAPERCSGLPVTRYSAADLRRTLGTEFMIVEQRQEVHTTPGGIAQPLTWIAGRRRWES
jgi:SAM-dependent methyltransferase